MNKKCWEITAPNISRKWKKNGNEAQYFKLKYCNENKIMLIMETWSSCVQPKSFLFPQTK